MGLLDLPGTPMSESSPFAMRQKIKLLESENAFLKQCNASDRRWIKFYQDMVEGDHGFMEKLLEKDLNLKKRKITLERETELIKQLETGSYPDVVKQLANRQGWPAEKQIRRLFPSTKYKSKKR